MTASLPELTLEAGPYQLRPFDAGDVPAVLAAGQDPLIPLITTVPAGCDEAGARAFIARQHERRRSGQGWSLAISNPEGPALGQIGLWPRAHERASVGYWVIPEARGRGVAAHALRAISRFGLARFDRLELFVEPWNAASRRTAERVGYRREGLLRQYQRVGPERRDMDVYALLPGELLD